MRLWHYKMIPYLPRQQLLGQHRECCALRGNSWGIRHSVVNYVFRYSFSKLVTYHYLIIEEMRNRGYHPNQLWSDPVYRGRNHDKETNGWDVDFDHLPYPEHSTEYLKSCLENLKTKIEKIPARYKDQEVEKFMRFYKKALF